MRLGGNNTPAPVCEVGGQPLHPVILPTDSKAAHYRTITSLQCRCCNLAVIISPYLAGTHGFRRTTPLRKNGSWRGLPALTAMSKAALENNKRLSMGTFPRPAAPLEKRLQQHSPDPGKVKNESCKAAKSFRTATHQKEFRSRKKNVRCGILEVLIMHLRHYTFIAVVPC